jgi:hypothetical protein
MVVPPDGIKFAGSRATRTFLGLVSGQAGKMAADQWFKFLVFLKK